MKYLEAALVVSWMAWVIGTAAVLDRHAVFVAAAGESLAIVGMLVVIGGLLIIALTLSAIWLRLVD